MVGAVSGSPPSDPLDVYSELSARERSRRRTHRALEVMAGEAGHAARLPRVRGPRSRLSRVEWILLPALALTAFVLVLFGDGDVQWDEDPFKAVDAFTSGFPSGDEVEGVAVTLGRALAPLVALYATIRLVMVLYAQRIREWRVRRLRDHTIVVGLGETGRRAVKRYRQDGDTVVAVTPQPFAVAADDAVRSRAYVVSGTGTDPGALHAAGIAGAARILCAEANDVVNVQIALDAVEAHSGRSEKPLEILAEASEASPAAALLEAAAISGGATLFSLREVWAWRLLAAGPLWRYRSSEDRPPDIVLVGGTELASALLSCACRWWHFDVLEQRARDRLRIVVLDPDAPSICGEALERHPELRESVDLRSHAVDLATSFDAIGGALHGEGRPWVVYVCLDTSDGVRRATARVIQQRLTGRGMGTVAVAVSARSSRADDADPRILEVDAEDPDRGFDPSRFDRVEALSRAIHGVYERHMRTSGEAAAPALKPFDELPPELQESNREQARGIREQLVSILRATAQLRDWNRVREFNDDEVDVLSELEHVRWCAERVRGGWAYGPTRDDERRLHPDLVPWADLPEHRREINREFMRERPWTLARVGEEIVHHPVRERLARATHDHRREVKRSSLLWRDLPEAERSASRAFVDDIPRKLLLVGQRIASSANSVSPPELTTEQVELLARREHERWVDFRGGEAWRRAGGATSPHPGLVSWDELPEDLREIDRLLVRAIPEMLAEAGFGVASASHPPSAAPDTLPPAGKL